MVARAVTTLSIGMLLLGSGPARAACPNLLWHPGFDAGVIGWDDSESGGGVNVYLVAAPLDRLGDPFGYAGLVTNNSAGGSEVGSLPLENATCAGVSEGDTVHVRGWLFVPAAQGRTGSARLVVRWSDLSHCDGTAGFSYGTPVSTPGGWTYVSDSFPAPVLPLPGIDSLQVGLVVTKNEAGGSFSAYYDDLFACVPEPRAGATGAAAGVALAGLDAGRRRRRPGPRRGAASGAPASTAPPVLPAEDGS